MAIFYGLSGDTINIQGPLNLKDLQGYVHGFVDFVELSNGRIAVVNEDAERHPSIRLNIKASSQSGKILYGYVIICDSSEIE